MSIFQAEVVMRTKHIRRDHSRVASSVLLIIPSANIGSVTDRSHSASFTKNKKLVFLLVKDHNHSLGVGISIV